ncbi:MAG: hypothetical protein CBE33_04050 [Candidatus Pelagibacter sp. TMED273]|nr:MAG: hypothetical protein CBE33_04050 [Candidatus Pelagibacter sp. TMED273]|tara:strand:+ start:5752 stop:6717 length:966 start_codon:yes stop_codon:yes gene_type:complete
MNKSRFKPSTWITNSFTDKLISLAIKRKDIVLLDADLSDDANLKKFFKIFPKRSIQNGIAEQDMVSMAGGIALSRKLLPFVNSFASFLTARANEQIYNNATEKTRIIYICLYAGLFPAGAGKSHQSLRDISVLSAIPNMEIFHPSDYMQVQDVLDYCVYKSKKNCAIRLSIGPPPSNILDLKYNKFKIKKGNVVSNGSRVCLFTYGQTMLSEAIKLKKELIKTRINLKIINMPNINLFDFYWLKKNLINIKYIFYLEDHMTVGGMGDLLTSFLIKNNLLKNKKIFNLSLNTFPKCGTQEEVLKYHKLDFKSLNKRILSILK